MKTVLHFFASAWENFFGRTRLAGLALSLALVVPAGAGIEGFLVYEVVENEITITDCATAASGALEIPATIEDEGVSYPVTRIGNDAFRDIINLTHITIPDSVTRIGNIQSSGFAGGLSSVAAAWQASRFLVESPASGTQLSTVAAT